LGLQCARKEPAIASPAGMVSGSAQGSERRFGLEFPVPDGAFE
jgi:hypothetical protein